MKAKKIIEAALFLSSKPLTIQELSEIAKCSPDDVLKLISELEQDLRERNSAIIVERIGNAFRLSIDPEVYPFVAHLSPVPEFSRAELRILAELATNGRVPLSKVKRMKNWESFLEKVLRLGVVRTVKQGRAKYLEKTSLFEKYFALTEE